MFSYVGAASIAIVSVGNNANPNAGDFIEQSRYSLFNFSTDLCQTRVHTTSCIKAKNDFNIVGFHDLTLPDKQRFICSIVTKKKRVSN